MLRPCGCRFAPWPHYSKDCRDARMPTRAMRPEKPRARKRFKPGERGNKRGIIYANDQTD